MANLNDKDIALIESHLDGLLSAEEQAAFTQRCLTDTAFADEVAAYKNALLAVKSSNRALLKAKLQEHAAQKKVKKFKILRGWIFTFAAAASLLIGGFFFWYDAPKKLDYEAAFEVAFQPTPSGGIEKSTNTMFTPLDSAYLAYDNRNWQTAIQLFDALDAPSPKSLFFKANAYIALKDVERALPILQNLKNTAQLPDRQEDVAWLIALCMVKKGDVRDIQRIAETPTHLYVNQAKKILDALK